MPDEASCRFTTRAVRRIGVVEIVGALNDNAIPGFRDAIATATALAGSFRVLVVSGEVTEISERAALVVVAECTTLRAKGGNAAWVSPDGRINRPESIAAETLYMTVYGDLETALELFEAEDVP